LTTVRTTDIVVRPPASDPEMDAFFQLAAAHFVRDVPGEIAASDLRRSVAEAPGADPTAVRGAFRGDVYVGGYLIEERLLRIGGARLPVACVGVVITHPDHRRQGVATALMNDAATWVRERGLVMLLLHGLADFYRPFGYVDVFDQTEHVVRVSDILTAPPSPYRVRIATVDDAPALLDLYERHYGPHPGSFVRTLERQAFDLRMSASIDPRVYRFPDGTPHSPPVVAVDGSGESRGYLVGPWGSLRAFGSEVAADDPPAALALLQWRASLPAAQGQPPSEIRWPLPPDALAAAFIADAFAVETRSVHRPWTGWQASLVDLPGLVRRMLPEWNARYRQNPPGWSGAVALTGGDQTVTLRFDEGRVDCAAPRRGDDAAALHPDALAPLLFGFRTVAWAEASAEEPWPDGLASALESLFPRVTPWIAPSDGC
jgi:predicted N-acetyltransferase YhbS